MSLPVSQRATLININGVGTAPAIITPSRQFLIHIISGTHTIWNPTHIRDVTAAAIKPFLQRADFSIWINLALFEIINLLPVTYQVMFSGFLPQWWFIMRPSLFLLPTMNQTNRHGKLLIDRTISEWRDYPHSYRHPSIEINDNSLLFKLDNIMGSQHGQTCSV